MKKILGKLLIATGLISGTANAVACGYDAMVGEICTFTYVRGCPTGFLPADGRSVSQQQYQLLYSLIGTTFGGSGTNFNLPDLRSRAVVGASSVALTDGRTAVALGQSRGTEGKALTAAQLPVHNHTAQLSGNPTATLNVSMSASGTPPADNSNTTAPSATNPYLSASPTTGGGMANVWSKQLNNPVSVSGINGSATLSGAAVTVGNTGGSATVNWTNPQIALNVCIAVDGQYPAFP